MVENISRAKRPRLLEGSHVAPGLGVVFPLDTCRQNLPLHLVVNNGRSTAGAADLHEEERSTAAFVALDTCGHAQEASSDRNAGPSASDGPLESTDSVGSLPPANQFSEPESKVGSPVSEDVDAQNVKTTGARPECCSSSSPRFSREGRPATSSCFLPSTIIEGNEKGVNDLGRDAQAIYDEQDAAWRRRDIGVNAATREGTLPFFAEAGRESSNAPPTSSPSLFPAASSAEINSQPGDRGDLVVLASERKNNADITAARESRPPCSNAAAGASHHEVVVSGEQESEGIHVWSVHGHNHAQPRRAVAEQSDQTTFVSSSSPGENNVDGLSGARAYERRHATANKTSSGAASVVASFLSESATQTPPSRSKSFPASHGNSYSTTFPPNAPTPLASIISGTPTRGGRGGTSCNGSRGQGIADEVQNTAGPSFSAMNGLAATVNSSPVDRGTPRRRSRFCNEEWPLRAKERRRIIRFPKLRTPPGERILYWVRGNLRVRDNLALSVAMWLSRELGMPLQALAFVDPAIGEMVPSPHPLANDPGLPGKPRPFDGRGQNIETTLPFRMAVEASALCEMEESLRALNVPLVALACSEGKIPALLARWCSNSTHADEAELHSTPNRTFPTLSPCSAPVLGKSSTTTLEGAVHIVITDECYHPRQLQLLEIVENAIPQVALYTVDSSSLCPVNTFHGRRAMESSSKGDVATKDEFRYEQENVLKTVFTELTHRERVPLEERLQAPVYVTGVESRAGLPESFSAEVEAATTKEFVQVQWDTLRALAAERFPGFGKPLPLKINQPEDLIAYMGGGECAANIVLRQTLAIASRLGSAEDEEEQALGMENDRTQVAESNELRQRECNLLRKEVAGQGYGGALVHLLRLGSISPVYVLQALLDRSLDEYKHQYERAAASRAWARVVDAVLDREYGLYRSYFFSRTQGRACVSASSGTNDQSVRGNATWQAKDWQLVVPASVWEKLQQGQRNVNKDPHTPEAIKQAGLTVPSSVKDSLFSAIQARLIHRGRLHPLLVPYWAHSIVKMTLMPSQAIALVIALAEELCLGATYAGDVVPAVLADAFYAFEDSSPCSTTASDRTCSSNGGAAHVTECRMSSPFRGGLQSALGGAEALASLVRLLRREEASANYALGAS